VEKAGTPADVVAAYLGAVEQQPVINFRPAHSDASFCSAGLYGPDAQPTTSFDANNPILMKCSFVVREAITGLEVSFSVFNFKGQQIFYSTISMADPAISVEAPGTYDIAAQIPARLLLPGRYFIDLALHTPNTQFYDNREQSLCFQIIGAPSGYHGFASEDLGHVYADVKWRKNEERRSEASMRDALS
jgi:hypothetical protein